MDIHKLTLLHALIIDPSNHTRFLYPNERRLHELEQGESVFLSCPGLNNNINSSKSIKSGVFECVNGINFSHLDSIYSFDSLTCKNLVRYEIRDIDSSKLELGYTVDEDGTFLQIMEIDLTNSNPFVTTFITKTIAGAQNQVFLRQMNHENNETLKNLHRSYKIKEIYETEDHLNYLTPGLLIPKSYFVYGINGQAAHSYLNSAPIKNKHLINWKRIQDHPRRLARQLRRDIRVFSGSLGKLNDQSILSGHLIPQYFWTLAYEPISQTAVAFVTHNSIDIQTICKNPVSRSSEVEMPRFWQPTKTEFGYSYMCEVRDFLRNSGLLNSSNSGILQEIYRKSEGLLYLTESSPKESHHVSCRIRFNALTARHALFFDPKNLSNFVYPKDKGRIVLAEEDEIVAVCPGDNRKYKVRANLSIFLRYHSFFILLVYLILYHFLVWQ